MRRLQILLAASIFATIVVSDYDKFYFSTGVTDWECDSLAFKCGPPKVCVRDASTNKSYCCDVGKARVCWTGGDDCIGTNGDSASSQVGCQNNSFCCLSQTEQCTKTKDQSNICWATSINPFRDTTQDIMIEVFSSLSSISPSETSYTFDLGRVFSTSTPVSSSASASATDAPSSAPISQSATFPTSVADTRPSMFTSQTSTSVSSSGSDTDTTLSTTSSQTVTSPASTTDTPTPSVPLEPSPPALLSQSDKIALGVGIGIGLPATIASVIGCCLHFHALTRRGVNRMA